MTHEYVIATGGRIVPGDPDATAVAWAADRVLAVGPDDVVRSISRGDSTFLDLRGRVATALPLDLARAESLLDAVGGPGADVDIGVLLSDAGLLGPDAKLEPGSPADLAFWDIDSHHSGKPRLVATLQGGVFTEGDERRGPFPSSGSGVT